MSQTLKLGHWKAVVLVVVIVIKIGIVEKTKEK